MEIQKKVLLKLLKPVKEILTDSNVVIKKVLLYCPYCKTLTSSFDISIINI